MAALAAGAGQARAQVLPELPQLQGDPAEVPPEPPPQSRAQRNRAMSDAVRRAKQSVGGQVLGAERVQFDGRDITRIKMLDDRGRIRYVDDDPQERADRRGGRSPGMGGPPRPRGDNPRTP